MRLQTLIKELLTKPLYIFLGQTQFLIEIHEVYTRQVLARRESSRTLNAELC